MVDRKFLEYVALHHSDERIREIAKELLWCRIQEEENDNINQSVCDDCDMTYPCCTKCIGA